MRIHVSGPWFATPEHEWNVGLAARFPAGGHEVFVPHENPATERTGRAIFLNQPDAIRAGIGISVRERHEGHRAPVQAINHIRDRHSDLDGPIVGAARSRFEVAVVEDVEGGRSSAIGAVRVLPVSEHHGPRARATLPRLPCSATEAGRSVRLSVGGPVSVELH